MRAQEQIHSRHNAGRHAFLSQHARSPKSTHIVWKGLGEMTPQADSSSTRKLPALEELQGRPQWVCWRKEQRKGKLTKVPYSPTTGRRAESDNPSTWCTYARPTHALHAGNYHRLGSMF